MPSDPLVAFARRVADPDEDPPEAGDPETSPEATINWAATLRPGELDDALAGLVADLDPGDAPHDAVRVLAVAATVAPDRVAESAPLLVATAAEDDGHLRQAARDALFQVARRHPGPDALATLQDAVRERPDAVDGRFRALVDGLDRDALVGWEPRVVASLAPALPDVAVDAVPTLVAVAEAGRAAARGDDPDDEAGDLVPLVEPSLEALHAVATVRPDAVPTERVAALAAVDDDRVETGTGPALVVLAAIDEERAAAVLAGNCERLVGWSAFRADQFLASLVGDHRGGFPALADAVAGQVVSLPSGDADDALAALADRARADPSAVAPGAATLAPLALDYRRSVRTTAALALHHVGRDHPEALPDWARPLADAPARDLRASEADRPSDDDGPTWPLGGLAAAAPGVADHAVERLAAALTEECHWDEEALAAYVTELTSGDPDVGAAVVGGLVPVLYDHDPDDDVGRAAIVLRAVLEACPAVAPAAAGPFVAARAAAGRQGHHATVGVLASLLEAAPDALRAAVDATYGRPAAYVAEDHGWTEQRRQVAVELFEGYDASWSDVNDWLSLSEVREEVRDRDDEGGDGRFYEVYATVALWGLLNLVVALSRLGHWLGGDEE
jgi:hypothetical protein